MKRIAKFLILVMMISYAAFTMSVNAALDEKVEPMPDVYMPYEAFYSEVQENLANVDITVIGDYDFITRFELKDEQGKTISNMDIEECVEISSDYAINLNKRMNDNSLRAVVVNTDDSRDYVSFDNKEKLETAINEGYFVVFMVNDMTTTNTVLTRYAGAMMANYNTDENNPDNLIPYACYVTKNNAGEYYSGTFYRTQDTCQETMDETILYHMWCLRNIQSYTKNTTETKIQLQAELKKTIDEEEKTVVENDKLLDENVKNDLADTAISISKNRAETATAALSSGDYNDFSIGYDWKSVYYKGWHQNVIGSGDGMPSFWEWINFFYLRNGESGNHYYAWAIEYSAAPNGKWATKYVDYQSNAEKYQIGGQLRAHYPTQAPESGTFSCNFGATFSKRGPSADIGFTRSFPVNDLEIIDTTNINYGRIRFNYPQITYTDYQMNTSTNNAIFIYKDTKKTGSYQIHHYRRAHFWSRPVGVYTKTYIGDWNGVFYK